MTATAADLAALTSPQIMGLLAELTGKPIKRAASKAEAISRYERAVAYLARTAPVTQAVPAAAPAPVVEEPAAVEEVAPAPAPAKAARVRKVSGKAAPAKVKAAKTAARKSAATAPAGEPRAGSKRSTILEMIRRPGGATEAEICTALGWVQAGATIGRVMKAAGIAPRREKDAATGRTRYFAA